MQIENKDKPKQNAQTNQTKPKNKSNETQTNQMKPNQTHSQTHTRNTTKREIARGKQSVRDRDQEVLTYDGWQRGSRRWQWQSVLWATVAIGSRSGGGVDERQRWRRGVESEGFFESPEKRVIDLIFSWEIWASVESEGFFVLESELQSCLMFGFFSFFFILNLELCFIKRSSVWIEAAFY